MIQFFKRIFALIVSARVAELEHELADRKFALHMAEHRIHDLEQVIAQYHIGVAQAQDPDVW